MAVPPLIASSITASRLNWLFKATTQVMLLPSMKQIMEYHRWNDIIVYTLRVHSATIVHLNRSLCYLQLRIKSQNQNTKEFDLQEPNSPKRPPPKLAKRSTWPNTFLNCAFRVLCWEILYVQVKSCNGAASSKKRSRESGLLAQNKSVKWSPSEAQQTPGLRHRLRLDAMLPPIKCCTAQMWNEVVSR